MRPLAGFLRNRGASSRLAVMSLQQAWKRYCVLPESPLHSFTKKSMSF